MIITTDKERRTGNGAAVRRDSRLDDLYSRPGFLIRRANQIAVWLFLEEATRLGTTTTQYGALVVLNAVDDLDQIGLAKRLGIDRSTSALVVGKLQAAGYVRLERDVADKRRKVIRLTEDGLRTLDQLTEPAKRARERLLAAFTPTEADRFTALLEQFVDAFNDDARAPLVAGPIGGSGASKPAASAK